MNRITAVPRDGLPAAHYNGVQQEIEGLRAILAGLLGDAGGYAGVGTTNGKVVEASPASTLAVRVQGPARLLVPITTSLQRMVPFVVEDEFTEVAVPPLNTTAGQSRNDLVVAHVDLGNTNVYTYQTVQGTPAATGTQVDPTQPSNTLKLARIVRDHGAGAIVNAMITDLRQPLKVLAAHQA